MVLADLKIENAAVEDERRVVEADLGPYLSVLLGTADRDVPRYFILVVALLLDPAAVLLLLAAASASRCLDAHPNHSPWNWRLALGAWFGCETRFTGNTIVERRRLSFAMEIPPAQHTATRLGL
jgi:hypothetical protein